VGYLHIAIGFVCGLALVYGSELGTSSSRPGTYVVGKRLTLTWLVTCSAMASGSVYSSVLLLLSFSPHYGVLSIRVLLYILCPHDPLFIGERRREISHLLYSFSQWNDSYSSRFAVKSIKLIRPFSPLILFSSIPSQLLRLRTSFVGIAKTLKMGVSR
jgi:hypothetical protein